jgi:hypothetical protein
VKQFWSRPGKSNSNCDRVRSRLSEYLDGSLESRASRAVRDHLAGCEECREDLASLEASVRMLRSLPIEPPPRSFAVRAPREAARPARHAWLFSPLLLGGATAVASVAFVVVLSAGLLMNQSGQMARTTAEAPSPPNGAMIEKPAAKAVAPAAAPRLATAPTPAATIVARADSRPGGTTGSEPLAGSAAAPAAPVDNGGAAKPAAAPLAAAVPRAPQPTTAPSENATGAARVQSESSAVSPSKQAADAAQPAAAQPSLATVASPASTIADSVPTEPAIESVERNYGVQSTPASEGPRTSTAPIVALGVLSAGLAAATAVSWWLRRRRAPGDRGSR